MKMSRLVKYAGALVALAICSACGSGSAVAPSTATVNVQSVGKTLSVNGSQVTIVPDRRRSRKKFEYIIGSYGSYASIFDYPKSDKQVGTINGVGGQGCTNVLYGYGNKIFWIVSAYNQITEYQVPQTPIKTLSVSKTSLGQPSSCAMNASGDLAVGILGDGDVVIFKNATGSGTVYTTPLHEEFFDGYDNQGNLFADGYTSLGKGFALVELPKGSSKFETLTTSNTVNAPGSVQWDGTYLTVFDQQANAFYQYTISGTAATLKNTIAITGAGICAQTWIVRGLVYCADDLYGAEIFKYPAGGSPVASLTGNFDFPLGVAVARR